MTRFPFAELIARLERFYKDETPVIGRIMARHNDPFLVLIGCLLSLRTKDETTDGAMERHRRHGGFRAAGHCGGYPRSPHIEQTRCAPYKSTRPDRNGAEEDPAHAVLAHLQSPPCNPRTHCLHAVVSFLQQVPRTRPVRPRRRDPVTIACLPLTWCPP
jgi:hypothetical protein